MKKLFFIFFILSSCVGMQEVNLYQTEIISTEGLNGFTSIDIFSSGGSDEIWGNSDNECNPFTFSALEFILLWFCLLLLLVPLFLL